MNVRLEAVAFEVADPAAVAIFWERLLDTQAVSEPHGALVPGDETRVGLRFVASESEQVGRPWLHVHLTSSSGEDQQQLVETALATGGRHLDVGQGLDEGFIVLADPGGNELCVIEPGNAFLAGTGRLGEITCAGSRKVGLYWGDALDWPLVWDRGEQTAIQSRLGGTKISWDSWDGSAAGTSRQRFDLVGADPLSEAGRLVSLGATRLARLTDGVRLADPDGNEFTLRAG